jgi:hypothetical protein
MSAKIPGSTNRSPRVKRAYVPYARAPRQKGDFDQRYGYVSTPITYRRVSRLLLTPVVGSPVLSQSASIASLGFSDSRTKAANPEWKKQVARGENATTNYVRTGGSL